jgi:hypothetical protein
MSRYGTDPNDSTKQSPKPLPENAKDRIGSPAAFTLTKTPNYFIATAAVTNLGFFFQSSASFASLATSEDTSNQVLYSGSAGYEPLTLIAGQQVNLHPRAISGSADDCAKIKFIYKSGLATGGF